MQFAMLGLDGVVDMPANLDESCRGDIVGCPISLSSSWIK
jgi:hypothetical protein